MKTFKQFCLESHLMGINIRSDKKAGISYADHIVDGKKKLESRESNSLKPYIGKRVAIVRTGEGESHAIGEVTVGEPHEVGEEEFRNKESEHLVPKGSKFDIKSGKTKHLYPMINPIRYDKPKKVGKGIISRKIMEEKIHDETGLPLNKDGTVTVYHHTSSDNANKIKQTGTLTSAGEPHVYVTTHKDTDTGYGDTAVPVNIHPSKLELDDEFPNGRKDFRIDVGKPGGSIKIKTQ